MTTEAVTQRLMGEISESMATLSTAVDELATQQVHHLAKMRRTVRWTIVGLILDLLLTVVSGFLFYQVHSNTNSLAVVDKRVSTQVLCPLYELMLRSYAPGSPTAKADPGKYESSFAVIEEGARQLGCAHVVRGRG